MKREICIALITAACSVHSASLIPAYEVSTGVSGIQNLSTGFVLGLDFDVTSGIQVQQLGAFDSNSDGLFASPIQVAIFDRLSGLPVTPVLEFSTASPGVQSGGSRFKDLGNPVSLPAGFQGSVVAVGYGSNGTGREVNGNAELQAQQWWFNDGGGALSQVRARWDWDYGTGIYYPSGFTRPNPLNYAAGTFAYMSTPIPEPLESGAFVGFGILAVALIRRFSSRSRSS